MMSKYLSINDIQLSLLNSYIFTLQTFFYIALIQGQEKRKTKLGFAVLKYYNM